MVRVGACFYLIKKGEFFSGKFDFVQVINTSGWQLRPKLCLVSLLRVADVISREWDRRPAWNPIRKLKSKRQPKKKNLKSKSRLMAEIASGNNYALCIHYFDVYNEFISHSNVNHCPWKGRGASERWTTMQYTLLPTINMVISFGQAEDKWILLGHATNACRARLGNMVTPHCTSRDWNPNQPSKEKAEVLTMIYCGSGWVC